MALKDQLISHWSLEEAAGNRVDDIGGNTLTDVNTVTQAVGKVGQAAQFTAVNQEVLSVADNAALSMGDSDFTIAFWVLFTTKPPIAPIVAKTLTASVANTEYIVEYVAAGDRIRFRAGNGSIAPGLVNADVFGSPPLATWLFGMAWHDSTANTLNIQINNGAVNSVAHSVGVQDGTQAFRLGGYAANYHDGAIDQVGVWKRLLSAAERTALYNGGNGLPFSQFPGTYTLAGNATPQPATGSGAGLRFLPLRTLSGSADQREAIGSGAGLIVPAMLGGAASQDAASGSGAGLVITAPVYHLTGRATPQAATGGGRGLVWVPTPSAIYVARPRPMTFVGGDH